MEDLRQQLAAAFAAERAEHLEALRAGLVRAEEGGAPDLRDLFRRAHSLKGAARAVDRADIETHAHALESLLAEVEAGARTLDPATVAAARRLLEATEEQPEAAAPDQAAEQGEGDLLRLSGRHLARLADTARTLSAAIGTGRERADELRVIRAGLAAARRACLRPHARPAEVAADLDRLLALARAAVARADETDRRLAQAAGSLERDAEAVLLVPAATLAGGLERMTRTLAAEAGKAAVLTVAADAAEADRRVLQGLREPVIHLLRNAVGHGIEPEAARIAAGKPAEGRLRLEIVARAGSLHVAVEDDGAGPDLAAIAAAARARGLIEDDAPPLSEQALLALSFAPGLTTAATVERLSGRGIGLDAVAEAARRFNGTARLSRRAAGGTRVELSVPLTLTRRAMLLVEVGGRGFALPARAVSRVVRVAPAALVRSGGGSAVVLAERDPPVPIVALAALLDLPAAPTVSAVPALLLERGRSRYLVAVDAVADVRPLAFGDAAAIAAAAPLVLGTAQGEDGGVLLVLSPAALLDRLDRHGARLSASPPLAAPAPQRTILVVDDSITTRTLERGVLEGAGYRVLVSVDGLDGLERLRAEAGTIDLVVADVEMPRLDGFGLLTAMRNDPALTYIPVVMMTSRNAPDDIRRGLDLGADAYVTKQEFEQGSLLATVGRLI